MAVYARGYRRYEGGFGSTPAALAIFREHHGQLVRSRAFRVIVVLVVIVYAGMSMGLYVQLGVERFLPTSATAADADPGRAAVYTERQLDMFLAQLYGVLALAGVLVALLSGAGLVADDLRTRALPLYLARAMRRADYVVGKALVVPVMLAWVLLLPGIGLWVQAGLWLPAGETGAFLGDTLEVPLRVVHQWATAAAGYTGVVLLVSTAAKRRGTATGIAAAVLFGGFVLWAVSTDLREGPVTQVLRHASLTQNALAELFHAQVNQRRAARILPDPDVALGVALVVLLVGLVVVWRRTRTVEVVE